MKGITALAHVAIKVKDIDKSLDFYVKKMGFPEMFRLERDGKLWIVYLRITDDQYLELFPEPGATGMAADSDAIGFNHMCLQVDDIDAVVAKITAAGIPLMRPIKKLAVDGNHQAWIEDPDGHRIELMQMVPGCMQEAAIKRLREKAPA